MPAAPGAIRLLLLSNGVHNFTVTAADAAGNLSMTSDNLSITIDATLGMPRVVSYSPDTAQIGDGVTKSRVLVIVGTAEANTAVNIFDGQKLLGKTVATVDGEWSFTTKSLKDGIHTFTATAVDTTATKNQKSAAVAGSSDLGITTIVDSKAPSRPAIRSFSDDTGKTGDRVTSDNLQTFSGSAEAGSTVKIYDNSLLIGSVSANAGGTWSFQTNTLSDGAHAFNVTAADQAGNVSANSAMLNLRIDSLAPENPSITVSPAKGTITAGMTNSPTLKVAGLAEAGSTIYVYDGTTLLGTAVAKNSGAWTFTAKNLADGNHSLFASAVDKAGNISQQSETFHVTVDRTAPSAATMQAAAPDIGEIRDSGSSENHITLEGQAEASSRLSLFDGKKLIGTTLADENGAWSFVTDALTNGSHKLTAVVTDLAGNASRPSDAFIVTIDNAIPKQLASGPAAGAVTGLTDFSNAVRSGNCQSQ